LTKFLKNDNIYIDKTKEVLKMGKLKIKQNKTNKIIVIVGRLLIYGALYFGAIAFMFWAFCQNTIY
jgi:hypothetical protein